MALKPCRECRKKVSSEADQCPHCGVPSPTVYPERKSSGSSGGAWAAALAGLAVILLLAICSGPEASRTGGVVDVESYDTYQPPEEAVEASAIEPLVSIPELAGQSPDSVAVIVGPPDRVAAEIVGGGEYPVHYYGDLLEVVFVEGKAEWITVFGQERLPYSKDALSALGFVPREPSRSLPALLLWQNVPEVLEVRLFPGQGTNAHYALVSVTRPM